MPVRELIDKALRTKPHGGRNEANCKRSIPFMVLGSGIIACALWVVQGVKYNPFDSSHMIRPILYGHYETSFGGQCCHNFVKRTIRTRNLKIKIIIPGQVQYSPFLLFISNYFLIILVLNMRFGSECEDKVPVNPMALAIINQISNRSKTYNIAYSKIS